MNNPSGDTSHGLDDDAEVIELSVIISCFNGLPWLEDQVRSILRYPYSGRWELLFVDNGSSDGTLQLLREYVPKFQHAQVLEEACRGKHHALNRGIETARGENIVFLDQDDEVTEGFLDGMVSALAGHDLIAGKRDMTWNGDLAVSLQATEGLIGHRWLPAASGCALGVRAQVARELRFSGDVGVADDIDFSWRAQLCGYTLAVAEDATMRYRLRGTAWSRLRQGIAYGEASVLLFIKFRPFGLRRRSSGEVWLEVKSILYWGRTAIRSRSARLRLAHRVGLLIGALTGSIRWRVWCP